MSPTVHEMRNEIRLAVGRFERVDAVAFTKESLVAICETLDADVRTEPTPPKPDMRAAILDAIDAEGDPDSAFRKAELEAIAAALDVD